LALVGQYLKRLGISSGVDHKFRVGVGGIAKSDTCLRSLGYCLKLALPHLFRADAGLCPLKIMQEISTQARTLPREIAFIIQWNSRSTPAQAIAAQRVLGTNFLVCVFVGKDPPLRHAAKRRRMKAVMQEIMFKAGRMTQHAGRRVLGPGANGSAHRESAHGFRFCTRSLDVGTVPSCSTLRQRMETHAASWFELAGEFNQALLPVNK
jgi:hypothetical protein